MKCITYSNGVASLSISEEQERRLAAAGVWLRDRHGEYSQVSRGLSHRTPSLTGEDLEQIIAGTHPVYATVPAR